MVIHFGMPGNRLFQIIGGVKVNVVPRTVAEQNASSLHKLADEFLPFHRAISFN